MKTLSKFHAKWRSGSRDIDRGHNPPPPPDLHGGKSPGLIGLKSIKKRANIDLKLLCNRIG